LSLARGARWPEVQRAPEHLTLFSVSGLSTLLRRNGFEPLAWRWVGKTSSLRTLAADAAPVAPGVGPHLERWLERGRLATRTVGFDPRTKFCLYARRLPLRVPRPGAQNHLVPERPPRIARRPRTLVTAEQAILEDLGELARARGLCDWMFEQYGFAVRGAVAEVGAGIGTFATRLLAAGAERLLLVEPELACAEVLAQRFADAPEVEIVRDVLPDAPTLRERAGTLDLVVCQNVLEHVPEDGASIATMAQALRPGGRLTLLVPAHPRLFGPLDFQYGHERRYTKGRLRQLLVDAHLEVEDLYAFNLLGVPGWWVKGRTGSARLGARSLAAFELALKAWRPIERRVRPPWGLSLVAHGIRPT
jgi:SAM-dependent methyltransferase